MQLLRVIALPKVQQLLRKLPALALPVTRRSPTLIDRPCCNQSPHAICCSCLLVDECRCVDLLVAAGRVPEAAFFARTYLPSRISEVRPR